MIEIYIDKHALTTRLPNGMRDITDEVRQWCDENLCDPQQARMGLRPMTHPKTGELFFAYFVEFSNDDDAMLFKLAWVG